MAPKPRSQPSKRATSQAALELMASDCLARRVLILHRTIASVYNDALRPLGLTIAQLNMLVAVAKLGPLSPGQVAREMSMDKSTMSRNVRLLRDGGWISVTPAPSGRGQVLAIRKAGRRLVDEALPLWQGAQERAQELLGEREAKSIRTIVDRATRN